MAQIMIVLLLPPRAFYRIRVRELFLKGTTASFFFPLALSAKTLIHCPSIVRLKLIDAPSFKRSPVAPVYPDFSEPAKSTRLMTENFSDGFPS